MRGVVFDLDGTLVDSEHLSERTWSELESDLGIEQMPFVVGGSADERCALIGERLGRPAESVYAEYWERLEQRYLRELRPVEPAYALAVHLRETGTPIAIASNSRRHRVLRSIELALPRLDGCVVVGSDEVRHPKPAPDLYRRAAERLGVAAESCVAFEDTPTGATAARAAGLRVIELVPPASATASEGRPRNL